MISHQMVVVQGQPYKWANIKLDNVSSFLKCGGRFMKLIEIQVKKYERSVSGDEE